MMRKFFALLLLGATLAAAVPVDEAIPESFPLEQRGSLDDAVSEAAALAKRAVAELRAEVNATSSWVCGSHPTDEEFHAVEAAFAENKVEEVDAAAVAVIRVYFHVIRKGLNPALGDVPYSQILAQINILNHWYAKAGLRFVLAGGERTTSASWFDFAGQGTPQQTQMKNARHKGTARDLNVYTVGFTKTGTPDLLGYATFPWLYKTAPRDDGVVIRFGTTPGGSTSGYNSGKNLVHEVGHWTGLYHTFQGGCKGGGDGVADTPAEAEPNFGCPRFLNTCPAPGSDPVHNFMDYSSEPCKNQFTNGQVSRLRILSRFYRGI